MLIKVKYSYNAAACTKDFVVQIDLASTVSPEVLRRKSARGLKFGEKGRGLPPGKSEDVGGAFPRADPSLWRVSIVRKVLFDLDNKTILCQFVDDTDQAWPLSKRCELHLRRALRANAPLSGPSGYVRPTSVSDPPQDPVDPDACTPSSNNLAGSISNDKNQEVAQAEVVDCVRRYVMHERLSKSLPGTYCEWYAQSNVSKAERRLKELSEALEKHSEAAQKLRTLHDHMYKIFVEHVAETVSPAPCADRSQQHYVPIHMDYLGDVGLGKEEEKARKLFHDMAHPIPAIELSELEELPFGFIKGILQHILSDMSVTNRITGFPTKSFGTAPVNSPLADGGLPPCSELIACAESPNKESLDDEPKGHIKTLIEIRKHLQRIKGKRFNDLARHAVLLPASSENSAPAPIPTEGLFSFEILMRQQIVAVEKMLETGTDRPPASFWRNLADIYQIVSDRAFSEKRKRSEVFSQKIQCSKDREIWKNALEDIKKDMERQKAKTKVLVEEKRAKVVAGMSRMTNIPMRAKGNIREISIDRGLQVKPDLQRSVPAAVEDDGSPKKLEVLDASCLHSFLSTDDPANVSFSVPDMVPKEPEKDNEEKGGGHSNRMQYVRHWLQTQPNAWPSVDFRKAKRQRRTSNIITAMKDILDEQRDQAKQPPVSAPRRSASDINFLVTSYFPKSKPSPTAHQEAKPTALPCRAKQESELILG